MTSTPSIHNIYQNIVRMAKREGYAKPERINITNKEYAESRRNSPDLRYEDGIIIAYGGGKMWTRNPETGKTDPNYDRYTVFKLYPDAEFLVIAWPMGLVQASRNPFKKDRSIENINLGEMAQEILSKYEDYMKKNFITLDKIKMLSEKSAKEESFGFRFSDLMSIYKNKIVGLNIVPESLWNKTVSDITNKPYDTLSPRAKDVLSKISISVWDVIQANSGGHPAITNISGLNYLKDPVSSTKLLQKDFVELLKQKIKNS